MTNEMELSHEGMKGTHPATAEPAGTESGAIGVEDGLTMTVPSTNGANPGKNLWRIEHNKPA